MSALSFSTCTTTIHTPHTRRPRGSVRRVMPPNESAIPSRSTARSARGHFAPTPEEYEWARELYRGEIRYVDANIGRVVEKLKTLGIYDDALIVVTSDHGEEFMEHGDVAHGHSLYEEMIRVPLIVKPPSGSAGRVVDANRPDTGYKPNCTRPVRSRV